jgi:hypothetical protein
MDVHSNVSAYDFGAVKKFLAPSLSSRKRVRLSVYSS